MQQQNQTTQNQQTQIHSQQTQIQQNQQNQISSIQQQTNQQTPTNQQTNTQSSTPVSVPVVNPLLSAYTNVNVGVDNIKAKSMRIEGIIQDNLNSRFKIPASGNPRVELYFNNQLVASKNCTLANNNTNGGYGYCGLLAEPGNLTPEATYSYKFIYKEDGREDSIKIGMFKTISLKETVACKFIKQGEPINTGGLSIRINVNSHGDGNKLLNFTFSCNSGDFASIKLISMDMKYGLDWDNYNFNRMLTFVPIEINFFNNQFNDNYVLNFSSDGLVIRAPETENIPGSKTINLHFTEIIGSLVTFNMIIKDTVVSSSHSNDPVTFLFSNLKFSDDTGNQYTIYTP